VNVFLLAVLVFGAARADAVTLADTITVSGDSISRAFNANTSACNYGDNTSRVWATGDTHGTSYCSAGGEGTFSHAERLECAKGGDVTIFNHAASGADMLSDFAAQATAIKLAVIASSGPRYVPVFMGHNDACTNTTSKTGNSCGGDHDPNNYCRTTNAAFEREFRRGMDQLIQIPSARILILATVRVSELCNFNDKSSCGLGLGLHCGNVWQSIDTVFGSGGICASLTHDCSPERRVDMYQTLVGYNQILESVTAEYAAIPNGGLSAGGAVKAPDVQIRFGIGPFNYRFASSDLSCCDCFHPSDQGQAKLAEFIWNGLHCSAATPCCATSGDPIIDAGCDALDTTTVYPGGFWPSCASAAECDDGNPCTTDTCDATAGCLHVNAPNGQACDDHDACTQTDACVAGTCVGTNPVVCPGADACHDAGTCNPTTGLCVRPARPDGTPCDDGSACTRPDVCQAGVCTGTNPVVCTAPDQCHDAGICQPATGVCSSPARPDGAPCSDGNACTSGDACQAGACVSGSPVVCTASDSCHVAGVCNPLDGTCSNPARPDGTPCDDGSVCTSGESCTGGVCGSGTPVSCAACEACDPADGCVAAPRTGCRAPITPGAARLIVRGGGTAADDTLTWKWGRGAATTKPELGNPGVTTGYTLCVYDRPADRPHVLVAATAPPGGDCAGRPCWRETGTGYRYGDKALTPDGILKLQLRAGVDGQAKIALKGKGGNLRLTAPPFAPGVTVQLKSDAGICWQADYGAPSVNGGGRFSARSE